MSSVNLCIQNTNAPIPSSETQEVRKFHSALSLFRLMADFNEVEKDNADQLSKTLFQLASDTDFAPLLPALQVLQKDLKEYQERVIDRQEYKEWEKINYQISLPTRMQTQLRSLLPLRWSELQKELPLLREKIEAMMTHPDWEPLQSKLNLVKQRIEELLVKIANGSEIDRIEQIGLTNLIENIFRPPTQGFKITEEYRQLFDLLDNASEKSIRDFIINNPKFISSSDFVNFTFANKICSVRESKSAQLCSRLDIIHLAIRAGADANPCIRVTCDDGYPMPQAQVKLAWSTAPLESAFGILPDSVHYENPHFFRAQRIALNMLLKAGANPNYYARLPIRLIETRDIRVLGWPHDGVLPLLMNAGMRINSVSFTVKKIWNWSRYDYNFNIHTPFSYACSRGDRRNFVGWLVYEIPTVIAELRYEYSSPAIRERIERCQQIRKQARDRICLDSTLLPCLDHISHIADLVLNYCDYSVKRACYDIEEELYRKDRNLWEITKVEIDEDRTSFNP